MVDVYREKPIRLVVKVTVPVKEHPKVNRLKSVQIKFPVSLSFPTFRDGVMPSLGAKSTFCVNQKMISLHNLNISVILIFRLHLHRN